MCSIIFFVQFSAFEVKTTTLNWTAKRLSWKPASYLHRPLKDLLGLASYVISIYSIYGSQEYKKKQLSTFWNVVF